MEMKFRIMGNRLSMFLFLFIFIIISLSLVSAGTPSITWEPPTPDDYEVVNANNVYLNTTITDDNKTSAFFDWNYSLVGYWNFEYHNSTGVFDNSSYNNFASFEGGLAETDNMTGEFGQAYDFTGGNYYFDAGNDSSLDITEKLTVEAWVYFDTIYGYIVNKNGGDSSATSQYAMYASGTQLNAYLNGGNRGNSGAGSLSTGKWLHCVMIFDSTLISQNIKFYIDGVLSGTPVTYTTPLTSTDYHLWIGRRHENYYVNAKIDEVKIFNRVLSLEEIRASYNNSAYKLYHNFTGFISTSKGNYTYSAYAIDADGDLNITSERNVYINSTSECGVDDDCSAGAWCNPSGECVVCTSSECYNHANCRNGDVCCDDDAECGDYRICSLEAAGDNQEGVCSWTYVCRNTESLNFGEWSGTADIDGTDSYCGDHAFNVSANPDGNLCVRFDLFDADSSTNTAGLTLNHSTDSYFPQSYAATDNWEYNFIKDYPDSTDNFVQIEVREWETGIKMMFGYLINETGATNGSSSVIGCCDNGTDCVYDSLVGSLTQQYGCYDDGTFLNTGSGDGADTEECIRGIWYAQDDNSSSCTDAGNTWSTTYSCCNGDDATDECDEDSDCSGVPCQNDCTCASLVGITINSPVNDTTIADVTLILNLTLTNVANTLWYTSDSGTTNTTLCTSCTGEQTTFIFVEEGSNTVNIYANTSIGTVTTNSSTFIVNMNLNYYDSYDDNSSIDIWNNVNWQEGNVNIFASLGKQNWDSTTETGDAVWADSSTTTMSFRNVLNSSNINQSGSYVRFNIGAGTDTNFKMNYPTICERSGSTSNCVDGTWKNLTIGESQTYTILAGESNWTDWLEYSIDSSKSYLVSWYLGGGGEDGARYKDAGSAKVYRHDSQDLSLVQDWSSQSPTFNNYIYNLHLMEVKSSTGSEDGNFTSYSINTSSNISSITNITWIEDNTDADNNISVQISADSGSNWYSATSGQNISQTFTGANNSLVYRVLFDTDGSTTISLLDMNLSWSEEVGVADTCTVPGSGNWAITCSDNCTWDTDFSVPANITMTGSGLLTWNANMTFTESHWEIYKGDGCEIVINPGGSIR